MDVSEIDDVMKRTARYEFIDGLREMCGGTILILVAALFFCEELVGPVKSFSAIGLMLIVSGGALATEWLVPALKRRITFPRTGEVVSRKPSTKRLAIAGALAMLVAATVIVALWQWGTSDRWLPLTNGVVLGFGLVVFGALFGPRRFFALAAFSVVAGILASLARLGDELGSGVYFAAMGTGVLASGALTLRGYLTRNREGR